MKRALFGVWLAVGVAGCPAEQEKPASAPAEIVDPGPLDVRTLSYPADWLVRQVGGDAVQPTLIIPAGEDPPYWTPPPDLVAGLAAADLIVANGAGFEKWTQTATLPERKVVDSAAGVSLVEIESQTHSHGKKGEHSHAGIDPHTWSDPVIYLAQARTIHKALSKARPDAVPGLNARLTGLEAELLQLDRDMAAGLKGLQGRKLAANHPAYNYVARRYELDIRSFDFDPEEVPTPEAVGAFSAWAGGVEGEKVLLWEDAPTDAVKGAFPEGVKHVVVDPLEQPPEGSSYDYLAQARANLDTWKALSSPPAPEKAPGE